MTFKVISESEKTCMVGDEKGERIPIIPIDYSGGITIPSTANGYKVTRIGSWAFSWCRGLTSVNIPETVRSIGVQAFNFTGITEINFPNSLESIESRAFQCCESLNSVFIPKSVTNIADEPFEGHLNSIVVDNDNPVYDSRDNCNAIIKTATNELIRGCKNTIIPKTVTKIGYLGFCHCGSGFRSIVIPESVTNIDYRAFFGSGNLTEILSMIKEPMAITLDGGCWEGVNPDEITLYVPKGTKELYEATEDWNVFKNITEVFEVDGINYDVTSPEEMTVEVMGGKSYEGDIVIPKKVEFGCNEFTVTGIGDDAFYNCIGLTSVTLPNSLTTIGNSSFHGCMNLYSFIIPEGVTKLGNNSFEECTNLLSITIPKSITSIGSNAFTSTNLVSIVVEEGNTVYDSRDNCNAIIEKETNTLISGCKNTTIPLSVTSIGREAFSGRGSLTSIKIPNSVTRIDGCAFFGCQGLISVTVQCKTPIAISDNTFLYDCNSNATLYVPVGSKSAYEAAICWQDFKEIIEKEDAFFVDNAVYLNDALAQQGGKTTLSLKMKNTAAIRGFQFDLYLPEGVTAAKNSKGKILGELSAGRLPAEDGHTLSLSEQSDGAIRFLCSSQYYDDTFTGNDGEIVTLQVNIAEGMAEGDYLVQLKDMKLTESNIEKYYETDLLRSYLTIKSYVIGDINSDKKVDVSDYTGVANYIHGNTPQNFFVNAADVDENGIIDVSDYTGIANIIHTGSIYGSNASRAMSRIPKEINTDISGNDNVVYIEPFTVAPGTQTIVSIKMKNIAEIRGFQFDLYLPEGMTAIKSPKGRIQGALNVSRLPEDDEHDLTFSEQQDGAIRFLCSSQYDETFTGNDGEIATLQVAVAENMTADDYPIVLRNIKLTETDISKFYLTEELETTVTVNSAADERLLLDEAATEVPDNATGVNVRVVRTIAVGNWSTICLPFAMTEEQVKEAFGDGVQLGDFTNWNSVKESGNVVGINVVFTTITAIEANHPYIIKVEIPVSEFTVDGVNIAATTEPKVQVGTKASERGYMYGTYTVTKVPEENLFLSANKFWYSVGDSPIKAFRAYFEFRDVLDDYYDVAETRITFSLDGNTQTGIDAALISSEQLSGEVYNLNGQRVGKASKGVYIVNGKKVVKK